ncbi:hypothetical protein G6O67_003419 [Ophiocordyceps sinensis]|uniref:Uncharacterized protein n=2 Tax=Ophiocordyceps sinensis TaxID=72228 RepID=A0A8H4V8K6_9HYPO|nr:hypothetical protein OCS_01968 [Ophiocordyceps sinensis CO18]KAF4511640.1 hypothetical protein G6O67_003419 [Ophiocordyceps sinensis]
MRHRCFRLALAWLLAIVGVEHLVAGFATARPTTWSELLHPDKEDVRPSHEPFNAEGQPVSIVSRAEIRCRYAFTNHKRTDKMYRVFLGHSMVPYPAAAWCDVMEAAVQNMCWEGDKLAHERIQWIRCDTDRRDIIWQTGTVAMFKLEVPADSRPKCVADAVRASVPGSDVDWMGKQGCYEAHGFEIEY